MYAQHTVREGLSNDQAVALHVAHVCNVPVLNDQCIVCELSADDTYGVRKHAVVYAQHTVREGLSNDQPVALHVAHVRDVPVLDDQCVVCELSADDTYGVGKHTVVNAQHTVGKFVGHNVSVTIHVAYVGDVSILNSKHMVRKLHTIESNDVFNVAILNVQHTVGKFVGDNVSITIHVRHIRDISVLNGKDTVCKHIACNLLGVQIHNMFNISVLNTHNTVCQKQTLYFAYTKRSVYVFYIQNIGVVYCYETVCKICGLYVDTFQLYTVFNSTESYLKRSICN